MRIIVSVKSFSHGLRQVRAVANSKGESTLQISVDYHERKLYLVHEGKKNNITISVVPVEYFTDSENRIASCDELSQLSNFTMNIGDISSFNKWIDKRPKGYEHFVLIWCLEFLLVEHCSHYKDSSGCLLMEQSSDRINVDCDTHNGGLNVILPNPCDSVDGVEFINVLEPLYTVIKDVPSRTAYGYIYFMNNTVKASDGYIRFMYTDFLSLNHELLLGVNEAKNLLHMAKCSYAEFESNSDSNDFKMKLDMANGSCSIIFFGATMLNGTDKIETRIYSALKIPLKELASIKYHSFVTSYAEFDKYVKTPLSHHTSIDKSALLQALKDAEAVGSLEIELSIDGNSASFQSAGKGSATETNNVKVECDTNCSFAIHVNAVKKLCSLCLGAC